MALSPWCVHDPSITGVNPPLLGSRPVPERHGHPVLNQYEGSLGMRLFLAVIWLGAPRAADFSLASWPHLYQSDHSCQCRCGVVSCCPGRSNQSLGFLVWRLKYLLRPKVDRGQGTGGELEVGREGSCMATLNYFACPESPPASTYTVSSGLGWARGGGLMVDWFRDIRIQDPQTQPRPEGRQTMVRT